MHASHFGAGGIHRLQASAAANLGPVTTLGEAAMNLNEYAPLLLMLIPTGLLLGAVVLSLIVF